MKEEITNAILEATGDILRSGLSGPIWISTDGQVTYGEDACAATPTALTLDIPASVIARNLNMRDDEVEVRQEIWDAIARSLLKGWTPQINGWARAL